ncbi:MAG: DUF447 domain-containing protein, partial [Candidatus Bathyarchaeia archaeon]
GSIVETIVATRNPDGSPTAAPMGVTRVGPDLLEIKPFKSSTTHRNLLRGSDACVNVSGDPELFLVTAFKGEATRGFKPARIGEDLSMESADASIHAEVLRAGEVSEERGRFTCRVDALEVRRRLPRAFSRGRAEAIEAIVHATRIRAFLKTGRGEDAEKLIKRFDECKGVVERVSTPSSPEVRVIETLEALIERWREEASR